MSADETETAGDRLFLIRLARGDGRRRAESLADFVRHVLTATGEKYHPTTVSMLERNQQSWRLDDVRAFAAIDPLRRGEVWLSALRDAAATPLRDPRKDQRISEQAVGRAMREDEQQSQQRKSAQSGQQRSARRPRPKE